MTAFRNMTVKHVSEPEDGPAHLVLGVRADGALLLGDVNGSTTLGWYPAEECQARAVFFDTHEMNWSPVFRRPDDHGHNP